MKPTWYSAPRPSMIDHLLVVLFLLGIYLGIDARLPGGIPIPGIVAGAAGGLLLLKNAGRIAERHIVALTVALVIFLLSALTAPNYAYLGERFKGFIQLSYSLTIAYAFFLAATRYDRQRLSRVFLWFCLLVLVGCALENFTTAFRNLSDAFRAQVFAQGVYVADVRDQLFYGRIRPKLFTSEPSAVTFAYTLFAFAWYVLAKARLKMFVYLGLLAAGYVLMRGPSLFLGIAAIPFYEVLLAARRGPPWAVRYNIPAAASAVAVAAVLSAAAVLAGEILYHERISTILSGHDISFFSRIIAPLLTAISVVSDHPLGGAGLTGWEFIEPTVQHIYANAPALASNYKFGSAAESITNYFWLHWIFLGLFWGTLVMIALSGFLRSLGAPSLLFCWAVWVVFGQSSGGYVDPRTWIVLLLACTVSVIYEREARAADAGRIPRSPRFFPQPVREARRRLIMAAQ
ncbi:hypothetical protein [Shumkonia mesophila]|uniref:hypothetical protein n=1 Tax=Shumkonia mesophila TaxID=2838854 RepID=UPI002934FAC0|nr:hypothetical protein [Shumkonia mesophila]